MVITGCASGSNSPSSSSSASQMTTVKVAVPAISLSAAIYLGKQKGFFSKQGIDIQFVSITGPSALAAGLASGTVNVATQTLVTMMQGRAQGIPFQVMAPQIDVTSDLNSLLVKPDSPIKAPKDLAGKTIAVSSLQGIDDLSVRQWVQNDGGDGGAVKFVLIPSSGMVAALQAGRVDGIAVTQPYRGLGLKDGLRDLGYYFDPLGQHPALALLTSSEDWLKSHSDVAKRFGEAIIQSDTYANAHQDEVRAILPTFIQISQADAQQAALPVFGTTIDRSLPATLAQMMLKWNYIQKPLDVSNVIWSGTPGLK